MQEFIGHIAATVIGATLLLILAVIAWRGQHASTSTVQYAAAKETLLDMAEFMEEDLSNMGAGLSNGTITETAATAAADSYEGAFFKGNLHINSTAYFDTTSTTRFLRFCSWTNRTTDINPSANTCDLIEYVWTQQGTVQVRTPANTLVTKPAYKLRRYVNGTLRGESFDTITQIHLTFLDAQRNPLALIANPAQGRNVRSITVRLLSVSPLGGGKGYVSTQDPALRYQIDETRWTRTIRPPNLSRVPTT